jgi:hypothetical protein
MDGILKKEQKIRFSWDMKKLEPVHFWYKCKMMQPLWKQMWQFLRK